jgi:hypothetical protein
MRRLLGGEGAPTLYTLEGGVQSRRWRDWQIRSPGLRCGVRLHRARATGVVLLWGGRTGRQGGPTWRRPAETCTTRRRKETVLRVPHCYWRNLRPSAWMRWMGRVAEIDTLAGMEEISPRTNLPIFFFSFSYLNFYSKSNHKFQICSKINLIWCSNFPV